MLTANQIMGGVGKVGLFMGLGVAGGIAYAAHEAAGFQEQMNVLQAVTGVNKDQFELLRKKALELGADLKLPNTSAQDAAEAMTELAKGGLSVKDTMASARGTIQLATAAQIDNSEAAKIQARALKAFDLPGTRAAHVADLLANGANASTAEMSDLALGMQQASAVFHTSGHTIDELGTSIAIMADHGITGSDAGTSLRTMMNRLNPQTKKAAEEFKKLGINVFDAKGNYKSMRGIIGEFSQGLDGLNPKQKQHALYTIFGSDAIRAGNILLSGGVKQYDKYHKKLEVTGTAQKMATAHTKGLNGAVQGFISSAQTAAIEIGTLFLPVLTRWTKRLSTAAQWLGEHKTTAKALATILLILAGAMVTLTAGYKAYMIVTRLAGFYQDIYKKSLIKTRIELAALWAWEKAKTVATKAAAAAQWLLNAAMDANPIMLVVIAVAALIAGFILLYQHSGTFREMVNGLWDDLKRLGAYILHFFSTTIPNAAKTAINWLKKNWKQVALWILFPFPMLVNKALDMFGIKTKFIAGATAVIDFIKNWAGKISSFFSSLPGRFLDFGSRMGNSIKNGIVKGITGLTNVLTGLIRSAINAVVGIWNNLAIPGFHKSISAFGHSISFGWDQIDLPNIPVHLATGGIVTSPTLAVLGDNPGHREAVIPLPDHTFGGDGGVTINLTVEGTIIAQRDLEKSILEILTTYGRRNGRVRLATSAGA